MKLNEAMNVLVEREKIKASDWEIGSFLKVDEVGDIVDEEGERYVIDLFDMNRDDWEICKKIEDINGDKIEALNDEISKLRKEVSYLRKCTDINYPNLDGRLIYVENVLKALRP